MSNAGVHALESFSSRSLHNFTWAECNWETFLGEGGNLHVLLLYSNPWMQEVEWTTMFLKDVLPLNSIMLLTHYLTNWLSSSFVTLVEPWEIKCLNYLLPIVFMAYSMPMQFNWSFTSKNSLSNPPPLTCCRSFSFSPATLLELELLLCQPNAKCLSI